MESRLRSVSVDGCFEVYGAASDGKLGTEDDVVGAARVKWEAQLSRMGEIRRN